MLITINSNSYHKLVYAFLNKYVEKYIKIQIIVITFMILFKYFIVIFLEFKNKNRKVNQDKTNNIFDYNHFNQQKSGKVQIMYKIR